MTFCTVVDHQSVILNIKKDFQKFNEVIENGVIMLPTSLVLFKHTQSHPYISVINGRIIIAGGGGAYHCEILRRGSS